MENFEIEEIEKCKKRFKVVIPSSVVIMERKRVLKELQLNAEIPGFRKGKAPEDIILRKYFETIQNEITGKLVQSSIEEIVQTNKINILLPINLENVTFGLDDSLKYSVVVEYIPEFELKEYKNIPIKKQKVEIKDEEIQEFIKNLQQRNAELIIVNGEKAKNSDHVYVDIEGTLQAENIENINASKKISEKNVEFILGKDELLPQIEEEIRNMNKGDKKEIVVTYKDDYLDKKFVGQTWKYEIRLNEIKEAKPPQLDDEFAKDLGLNNLEELKNKVKEELIKAKNRDIDLELKVQIKEAIASNYDFTIPEVLIKEEAERLDKQLSDQMPEIDKIVQKEEQEKIKNNILLNALKNVKTSLVLEKIAEKEKNNIKKIEDKDIDKKIDYLTWSIKSEKEVKKIKENPNVRTKIYSQILMENMYEFLINNANIVEANEQPK